MKNRHSIRFLVVILGLILSAAGPLAHAETEQRDGVFLHISRAYDDPHRCLMALKMAVTMSEGHKAVLIYCDIEAVKMLVKGAAPVTHAGFPSSEELLKKLADLKIVVMACPTCMKVAGVEAKDLRSGVIVAERDRFFSFTSGRILTLDY